MNQKKYRLLLVLLIATGLWKPSLAITFNIVTTLQKVTIVYAPGGPKLDSISASLLAGDIELVSGYRPTVTKDITTVKGNVILIGTVQTQLIQSLHDIFFKPLNGKWECYSYKIIRHYSKNIQNALVITGSDPRGTAYGVFELSKKLGVSPWYWWADVKPVKRNSISIGIENYTSVEPSVKYRGIFINDEDWGLQPWAAKTFEPETGDIGPKTYAKVFELLLRLKANLIWPAMHPSTKPFFHYPGNPQMAADYQIVVGSSHAEPMLRNNVGEWDVTSMGDFNYFTNKEMILQYWENRVKQSKGLDAIYSMGMRGVHDGQMEGIKDLKEAVPIIEKIIQEQRDLLFKYINTDVTAIPQVLTPYKEVLDIYDNGLKVPDDITLVWPDDNYGYISRLNNEKEKTRKGGAGVYYHASYWGRPHDYLWLPSTHPSLVREEMIKAYESGADRLWVLNVGDIKPQEYNMQQFLDMAYNPIPFKDSRYTKQHLLQWLTSLFGIAKAQQILPILWEYYGLAFERKPEFMGWSQTEPETKTGYTDFNHFYYGDEAQIRIDSYNKLESAVKKLRPQISIKDEDAFYQLVYYPVVSASWMNKKFLYRDKACLYARQNRLSANDFATLSRAAYDSIVKETSYFNLQLAGGKWKNMMSMNPRNLDVYAIPGIPVIKLDETNSWSIAPEGFVTNDSSLISNAGSLSMPAFDNLNRQKFFVDIFLNKAQTINWKASPSQNWIRLSNKMGMLNDETGRKQMRIWVDVDWNKFGNKKKMVGNITFEAGGKKRVMEVHATKFNKPGLSGYNGFIENNGYVSINASHFTGQTNKLSNQWKIINDFGYTGNVLQAFPLSINPGAMTEPDSIKANNAFVEYDFYTFSSSASFVTVYGIPTHPINNNMHVRYAVSIDNGPLQIVDMETFGRSEEWKQNVLRNRAEKRIAMPYLDAGKHTLQIYIVDPGVILDRIVIDLGGFINAYSTIPESKF